MTRLHASLVAALLLWNATSCWATEAELEVLMERMENMVLELRDQVEEAYSTRCGITESDCSANHYYDCFSEFPEPSCKSDGSWDVGACLEKSSDCGALWDFTTSGVRIPEDVGDDEPYDTEVIETVCYSQLIDDFLIDEYEAAQASGDDLEFLGMFFGAWNGVFRIYPARAREECGTYDPRYRPWYVAASSGPKNVILLIDTSGSMGASNRMELAKEAAQDVLSTLTVADYAAVIQFNSDAELLLESANEGKMVQATADNIEALVEAVNDLEEGGATNFEAAFELAFEVLDESFADEANTNCETAILFLTDGEPTVGTGYNDDETQLYSQISSWNSDYGANIFSYSLGSGASTEIPKAISCQESGIWSYIEDGGNLREQMAGFYTYYAAGMGTEGNRDFTAWVEPYEFATGDYYGTTVSAPVYDTSTSPWRFLGAVGIDFSVTYMEEVAGGSDAYSTVLDALEAASSAFCPETNLTECNVQALRDAASAATSYDGTCDDQCSSFSSLTPEACMASSEYPTGTDLWENYNYQGKSYTSRTCCGDADENDATVYGSCSSDGVDSSIIVIAVLVPVLFFLGLIGGIFYYRKYGKQMKARYGGGRTNTVQQQQQRQQQEVQAVPVVQGITAPPPSAPPPSANYYPQDGGWVAYSQPVVASQQQ